MPGVSVLMIRSISSRTRAGDFFVPRRRENIDSDYSRAPTLGARMKFRKAMASKLVVPLLIVGGITTACWIALLAWGVGSLLGPFVIEAFSLAVAVAGE